MSETELMSMRWLMIFSVDFLTQHDRPEKHVYTCVHVHIIVYMYKYIHIGYTCTCMYTCTHTLTVLFPCIVDVAYSVSTFIICILSSPCVHTGIYMYSDHKYDNIPDDATYLLYSGIPWLPHTHVYM